MVPLSPAVKQYLIITGNYWAFTLTDGALRMLVVLHFNALGYNPLQIAALFLFYEAFGVITNLVGGYVGALVGLNRTMNIGLGLQVLALIMLVIPNNVLTIPWVMCAQAISGVAKDLNKMSAKSAIKLLVSHHQQSQLFTWIALLTGSKNTLKGVGFFLGGVLLSVFKFEGAIIVMAAGLAVVWLASILCLKKNIGKVTNKPKFTALFSKSPSINILSAARLFLFGARDIWFVVALPVFLSSQLQWDFWRVGGLLASWTIGYGIVQSFTPNILGNKNGKIPAGNTVAGWTFILAIIIALIASLLATSLPVSAVLIVGLFIFGIVFAISSSLHSYLIVNYANSDGVSLDVGFYYMANAMGRLIGTLLSGWIFQSMGFVACLWTSFLFIAIAAVISLRLPHSAQGS